MAKKKLRRLSITGFRGIRHTITIDFTSNNHSILIFGANAKGKSSIADAFEWFFNGEVKELTKEGCTREDYRHRLLNDDEDTIVGLDLSDTDLSSEFRLHSSRRQNQTNETEEFNEYISTSKDELLILRHKDLKQFVDETKGEKRKQIAQLIGMEGWENLRNDMAAVENRLNSLLEQKEKTLSDRQEEVAAIMGLDFSYENCWHFAEQQAEVLGFDFPISSLDDLRKLDEEAKKATKVSNRSQLLTELNTTEKVLSSLVNNPIDLDNLRVFENQYNSLSENPEKVLCVHLNELYDLAKSLLESEKWTEDTCPLCNADIPREDLISHIQDHQEKSKETILEVNQLEATRIQLRKELRSVIGIVEQINELKTDKIKGIEEIKKISTKFALAVGSAQAQIEQPLKTGNTVSFKEFKIEEKLTSEKDQAKLIIGEVSKKQKELAPTKEETAKIEAFQNLGTLRAHVTRISSMEDEIIPLEKQVASLMVFTAAFQELRRNTMGSVLETISDDVSRYFLALHPTEGFDDVSLKFLPNEDGVEFHIYYKGEEITPPRKFLSESYLNGLGVCLFLATVRAFNKENGFVILDDIVNSFDAEHRADLARLLVNELPDHQLIVLTHDNVWFDLFRRLARRGWQHKRILRWSYENGVEIETPQALGLAGCREALSSGKVEIAAPRVRTYMENRLKAVLKKVGGRVRFREGSANDERSSGELLFELKRYLSINGFFDFIEQTSFDELEASTFIVNYGSHDRPPAPVGLVIGDVEFALERLMDLEKTFICPSCNKKIWNLTDGNYHMQCECGKYKL